MLLWPRSVRIWHWHIHKSPIHRIKERKRSFNGIAQRVATESQNGDTSIVRTRNIGIIAHIDAVCAYCKHQKGIEANTQKGKTTTTERMLYYSGHTRRIGSMFPILTPCLNLYISYHPFRENIPFSF